MMQSRFTEVTRKVLIDDQVKTVIVKIDEYGKLCTDQYGFVKAIVYENGLRVAQHSIQPEVFTHKNAKIKCNGHIYQHYNQLV